MQLRQPTKRDQSGFSVIEALLVVLVIAALAVTGFLVYQRHKSGTKTAIATNSPQTSTAKQSAQAATQYLTISEWGVKVPLSDPIKDAYYNVKDSNITDGLPNTAWLGLKSLDGSTECNASLMGTIHTETTGVGAFGRAHPTDHEPVKGTLYTQLYPGVTIGNYYYFYISGIKGKTCAPQATLQAIDSAFATAAKNMVPVSQYLDIKEWGVRAPYSGSLKLSYTVSSSSSGGGSAVFSSDQLTALSSDCPGRGGSIIRWASTDQVSEGPPDESTPTAASYFAGKDPSTFPYAHIGNYYYTFAHDQAACGDLNTTAALQSQTNDAVKALVPNLQAIPN